MAEEKSDKRLSLPRRATVAARFHNGLAELVAGYGEALHDLEARLQVAEAQALAASVECERLRGEAGAQKQLRTSAEEAIGVLRARLHEAEGELAALKSTIPGRAHA